VLLKFVGATGTGDAGMASSSSEGGSTCMLWLCPCGWGMDRSLEENGCELSKVVAMGVDVARRD